MTFNGLLRTVFVLAASWVCIGEAVAPTAPLNVCNGREIISTDSFTVTGHQMNVTTRSCPELSGAAAVKTAGSAAASGSGPVSDAQLAPCTTSCGYLGPKVDINDCEALASFLPEYGTSFTDTSAQGGLFFGFGLASLLSSIGRLTI